MSGNTFGKIFTLTTFGESHGKALGCIIDGCPPGIKLSENDIQKDLDRRKPGQSKYTTQRKESDKVEILSGVFDGKTTGTPISLIIFNEDQRPKDYGEIKDKFRPGHADYTYSKKYGFRDYRGAGRSSARETVARVAGGAVAKKVLKDMIGLKIFGYVSQIGEHKANKISKKNIESNPFFFPDKSMVPILEKYINSIRKSGDSIGAEVTVIAENVPPGLGNPVFDKLDALIAYAMMSINAVKGVEIGNGFNSVQENGKTNVDEMIIKDGKPTFLSNNNGGILGGISSGQDIIARFVVKPTSSIISERRTIDVNLQETSISTKGRHDPCVGIRAVPVGEAMLATTIADHCLRYF